MPEKKSEKQAKAPAFEEGLDQLEKIVKQLEDGDLPLEKSLELFEKGVRLSEACRKQLQEAEGKVEILACRKQLQEAEGKVEILLKKQGRVEAKPFNVEAGEPEA